MLIMNFQQYLIIVQNDLSQNNNYPIYFLVHVKIV